MLLYFVRHGDPIYDPDSLTDLGQRQAEAVGRRIALHGVDKIFASSSVRAMETARPTAEILKKETEILDWCSESYAWEKFTTADNGSGGRTWLFYDSKTRAALLNPANARPDWYTDPAFSEYDYKSSVDFYEEKVFQLFDRLGFTYNPETGLYRVGNPPYGRVALFAHQGFGMAFLSTALRIPYSVFSTRFDINHTGMTVLFFPEDGSEIMPKIITLSDCGHLYKDGLPVKYQNSFYY